MVKRPPVAGTILDENNRPIPNVNISVGSTGTTTDSNGYYLLLLIAETQLDLSFTHIAYENVVLKNLILTTNETFEFNPVMKTKITQVAGVEVTPTGEKSVEGITTVDPEIVRKIPGANAGVENILKLLPGVSFNNELSTQYNVRGGNFDENLVYVNGIEVFRPFLVRSAQQEGLGFVNSDMITSLEFSSGGFQARYGDKLSSVLDITYKTPIEFGLKLDASLLGASATVESISKNKKFSSITGLRYRNNSLLVNSQQTESNFNPTFVDVQSLLTYRFSKRLHLNFLGTYSINDYKNEPLTRQTNFGTVNNPSALLVFYEGQENNSYENGLAAVKTDYLVNDNTKVSLTASVYHTQEEEFSDIIASYELGELDTNLGSENLGEVISSRGVGSQFNRARNQLDALIFNLTHKGTYKKGTTSLEWGARFSHEILGINCANPSLLTPQAFLSDLLNLPLPTTNPKNPLPVSLLPMKVYRLPISLKQIEFRAMCNTANRHSWVSMMCISILGLERSTGN